jgi:hypothetical protein
VKPDYFSWIDRQTRRESQGVDLPDREEPVAPSEPIEVLENNHVAIMRRLRRFWHDKRS